MSVVGGVQARHPQLPSDQDCAGKHGDDDNLVKAQVQQNTLSCEPTIAMDSTAAPYSKPSLC